jgi:transposase InsO family protein
VKDLWIGHDRLKQVSGWSDRVIRRRVKDGTLTKRDKQEHGRNGRPVVEYGVAGLPPDAQLKAYQLQLRESRALVTSSKSNLSDRQAELPFSPLNVDGIRMSVPLGRETEAERRYTLIKPLLEWDQNVRPDFLDDDGMVFRSKDQLAGWIARHSDPADSVARPTLWRLVRRWKGEDPRFPQGGLAALLPKVRNDKGQSRYFDGHPAAAKFVLAKYAEGQGHYSDVLIRDALIREWPTLYGTTSQPPSIDTVRTLLQGVPKPLRDVARLPRQEHDQKNAPYLITDIEGVRANEIWICDHRIYDVLVFNDCFEGAESLAAIRLWETCIEDMRTRVIVGSVWNVIPSSRTISSALRQAISKYGKPEIFYTDNGKDFRKIGGGWANRPGDLDDSGRIRISPAADGLLARLGIKVKYCIPRHPQSKQIESYFSTVSKRFDVIFGSSYAGRKPSQRPDACREAEKLHRLYLKEERQESPFVAASDFVISHRQWTEEFNSTHEHGGRGMNKRSPYDVLDELLPPEKRVIPDMAQLEPLFWDRVLRTVSNSKVQLGDAEYESSDDAGAVQMYLANGAKVLVARDPEDSSQALALNQDGQFIAYLHSKELVARGPQSEDAIKAISRHRNRLYKTGKQFWNAVRAGVPTEAQQLAARAKSAHPAFESPALLPNRLALRAAVGSSNRLHCAEDTVEEFFKEGN